LLFGICVFLLSFVTLFRPDWPIIRPIFILPIFVDIIFAFLVDAYDEEQVRGETRNLLRFHPALAPVKVAVFPLVKRDGMPETGRNIYNDLKKYFNCFYDEKGAIGRRYRRQDEAGTPFCITVDGQTLKDNTVTVRDRDSMEQVRVSTDQLLNHLREKLEV